MFDDDLFGSFIRHILLVLLSIYMKLCRCGDLLNILGTSTFVYNSILEAVKGRACNTLVIYVTQS